MNLKTVYILRFNDGFDNEQIGIFESKVTMFKALHVVLRDHLDVDLDDSEAVRDELDYFMYEKSEVDISLNTIYTLYEYNSHGFDFISTCSIKPVPLQYQSVVESKVNQIDLKGIYL